MQIQRQTGVSAYGLFHRGQQIGQVNGRRIGFHGFSSREDAAAAAWAAAQEVELRRRSGKRHREPANGPEVVVVEQYPGNYIVAHCQTVATLIQVPGGDAPGDPVRWGFEIELASDLGPDAVALGLARVMWRGIRARRLQLRMEQFAPALIA